MADDCLKALVIICEMGCAGLFIYAILWGLNRIQHNKAKKANRIFTKHKSRFEVECEIAGRKMMSESRNNLPNIRKKQNIKYTGLFSGENAPKE